MNYNNISNHDNHFEFPRTLNMWKYLWDNKGAVSSSSPFNPSDSDILESDKHKYALYSVMVEHVDAE